MTLRHRWERSGNWLFRHRSYLPLAPLALALLCMRAFHYPGGSRAAARDWELFCLAVAGVGLAVRGWTIGHTPRGTSGRNTCGQIAETLNTTGPYSVVRHPLYVGNFLIWMGIAMFVRSGWLLLVVSLFFWLCYERIMFAEEEFLRARFGAAFEEWAARTPAFLPAPRRWKPPPLPFSLRNAVRREYSALFGIIATFSLLEAVGDLVARGRVDPGALWPVLFPLGLAVYLLLRTLKRRTRLLHVEGR